MRAGTRWYGLQVGDWKRLRDLSPPAVLMFLAGRERAAVADNDGRFDEDERYILAATLRMELAQAEKLADQLVTAGLWKREPGQWIDSGYLDCNRSNGERLAEAQRKARWRAGRDKDGDSDGDKDGDSDADGDADGDALTTPHLTTPSLNVVNPITTTPSSTSPKPRVRDSGAEDEGTRGLVAAGTAWFAEHGQRKPSRRKLAGLGDLFDGGLEPWHLVTALDIADRRGHAKDHHPNQVIDYITEGRLEENGLGSLLGRVIADAVEDDQGDLAPLRAAAGGALNGDRR